ncbi:MAG: hypothetical protein NTW19_15170 [Planctomycetota bacterium]|nr:hypothetical protein [Planctomycetota bacterium]
MKRSFLNLSVWTLGLAAALLMAGGCQSEGSHHGMSHGDHSNAMMCDKCKTVWIQNPGGDPHKPWTVKSSKGMECPDCKTAAANFFATGKFEHTCSSCGGSMEACEMH